MDVLAPAKRASGWMLKLAIERLALFAIALALGRRLFIQVSQICCRVGMVFSGFRKTCFGARAQPFMRSCYTFAPAFDFPISNITLRKTHHIRFTETKHDMSV